MCGIYGVLRPRDTDLAIRQATAMGHALAHRGPDGVGLQVSPLGVLGHRRLAIIDLSPTGAQPMSDRTGTLLLSINGEIYNYRELRAEYAREGYDFISRSDSEVVLAGYRLHGEESFGRLNGIFAFCLTDASRRRAFLVRDPMGVKPLYWAETGQGVFFASELEGLLKSGAIALRISGAALQAYLQLDSVPAPLAAIVGVNKLREGHLLEIRADGTGEPRRYDSIGSQAAPQSSRRQRRAQLGEVLRTAVQRQLVADVPVGVLLSGGLDSSIVALLAGEVLGRPVATFSVGFDEPSFDESRYFEQVARKLGTDHHQTVLTARSLLDLLPRISGIASEPLADSSIFPTTLLAEFTRRHVKVALGGDGADELLAGYPTHAARRAGALAARLPGTVRRNVLSTLHRLWSVDHANLSRDFRSKKFLEGLHRHAVLRNTRWLGSFLPEELPTLLQDYDPRAQEGLAATLLEPSANLRGLSAVLRTDERFYLQDQVLVKVDRASMANALEVRVPFLDPDVVALTRGLPDGDKLRWWSGKALLREWATGRLPNEVVRRPKKGFGTPLARWFCNELRELVGDVLSPRTIARQGFFDPPAVARLLQEHWAGRRDHRKRLFSLLTFTLWHEHLRAVPRAGEQSAAS